MAKRKRTASTLDIAPSDVVFAEATDRQRTLSWELVGASAASWAPRMTQDEYVGCERALCQTELSTNGGTKYYVLARKDDPEKIVSSCEITSKSALVAGTTGTRIVSAYAIARILTAPQYSGNGMTSHLLNQVRKIVDETYECGAVYSFIGNRSYYTDLGWKDFPSPQLVFKLGPALRTISTANVTLLSEADMPALCDKDFLALAQKFQELARSAGDKTYITFLPSFRQCTWHFTRDTYLAKILGNKPGFHIPHPVHHGAKTIDNKSWLYWDHDRLDHKIKILRIVTDANEASEKRKSDIKALLGAALAEARSWGISGVVVWNPYKEVGEAATEVWRDFMGESQSSGQGLRLVFDERQARSIPYLRWKGGDESRVVVWEDNEYFSWC